MNLIEHLFRLRDILHLFHLATKNYNQHIIAEEFYTKLLPLIDVIAETIQGEEKKHLFLTIKESKTTDEVVPLLQSSKEYIISIKNEFSASVQSLIDEVINLESITIYKMSMLK